MKNIWQDSSSCNHKPQTEFSRLKVIVKSTITDYGQCDYLPTLTCSTCILKSQVFSNSLFTIFDEGVDLGLFSAHFCPQNKNYQKIGFGSLTLLGARTPKY